MSENPSPTRPDHAAIMLDALGTGPGFRKLRQALGVQSLGINGLVLAPNSTNRWHWHAEQEEVYVVLEGQLTVEYESAEPDVVGPGGVVRVDSHVVRRLANHTGFPVTIIAVGAKDGYVGRDGRLTPDELEKLPPEAQSGFTA